MANDNLMYALPLTFLFYLKAGAIGIYAIAHIYNIYDTIFTNRHPHIVSHILMFQDIRKEPFLYGKKEKVNK